MGQKFTVHILLQWAIRDKSLVEKRHLSDIFAHLHSLKVSPVYCGDISYDVVTALTHCKSVSFPSLSCVSTLPNTHTRTHTYTRQSSTLFFPVSLILTASIHFYLYVSTSRCSGCLFESRHKLQQRTECRPLPHALFPIYWVP